MAKLFAEKQKGGYITGIRRIFIQELDPATELPKSPDDFIENTSITSIQVNPLIDTGTDIIKRGDCNINAIKFARQLLYGYDMTITDDKFNIELLSLLVGDKLIKKDGKIVGSETNKICECIEQKHFRVQVIAENRECASVLNYVVFIFNNCVAIPSGFTINNEDFATLELTIRATDASKAGLPMRQNTFVDTLPDKPVEMPKETPGNGGNGNNGKNEETSKKVTN